jgi:helix-turn-helix protein
MNTESFIKFWPLIYSAVKEMWNITEPHIEDAAIRIDLPLELYFYSELGLEYFSIPDFQKRDPFSNPEQFEKLFARLVVRGWIAAMPDGRYQVTEKAREGARQIIRAGDTHLANFESMLDVDLEKLALLLKQLVTACADASEPPQKWAILKRFRVADKDSSWLPQIRESLMDLFAYRDDSHLSASHPHFGRAGIVWSVLGSVWSGDAVTADQMTETMAFRGYDVDDYEVAIQAAVEIDWVESAEVFGAFRPTQKGREMREQVERLTNEYFYKPWSVIEQDKLDEMYYLLTKLRDQLHDHKKVQQ